MCSGKSRLKIELEIIEMLLAYDSHSLHVTPSNNFHVMGIPILHYARDHASEEALSLLLPLFRVKETWFENMKGNHNLLMLLDCMDVNEVNEVFVCTICGYFGQYD